MGELGATRNTETGPLFVAEIWLPPAPFYALDRPAPKTTCLIEPPPIGKAAVVKIVYSRMPKGTMVIPPDVREIGYTQLKSGDFVAVFVRPMDFDCDEFAKKRLPEIQMKFARNPHFLVPNEKMIREEQDFKMLLVNNPRVDGRLMILDAAVHWLPDKTVDPPFNPHSPDDGPILSASGAVFE